MRIAIMGIRGVPANYGGFETFAEQLGARMVERSHRVTVYGRDRNVPRHVRSFRGMDIVRLPAPRSKYLETVVHSLFAAIHATFHRYDIVYVCNSANVPAVMVLRMTNRHVVLNVDGLEWQRAKWNRIGKTYYRACAWMAARLPVQIVTDAAVIQEHYLRAYGRETNLFPYGTDVEPVEDDGTLARLRLEPRRYILYVSRLEPENNAHVVIEAYGRVATDLPLVIVGDAPYADAYIAELHRLADRRVRFTGGVYGAGYRVLQSHAAIYVQATEVGGTHPALLEAMGYGNAAIAYDLPAHRESLADTGVYYRDVDELVTRLRQLLDDPEETERLRHAAHVRAQEHFSWDVIADGYERWFRTLVEGG